MSIVITSRKSLQPIPFINDTFHTNFVTRDGGLESTSHVRTAATWPEWRDVDRLR